jgi:hypothetical protein
MWCSKILLQNYLANIAVVAFGVNFKVAIFRVKMTTAVFSETLENVYQ